jgi:transposase
VKGRKRHVAVDTLGWPLAIVVTGAHVPDNAVAGVGSLLWQLRVSVDRLASRTRRWPRLTRVVGDGSYRGRGTAQLFARMTRVTLVSVRRTPGTLGLGRRPDRWVIERTFGWFQGHRRLVFDFEFKPANSEGMLWLATIGLMLRRICAATS